MMSCNISGRRPGLACRVAEWDARGRSEAETDCRFRRGLPVWDLSLPLLAEAAGSSGQCGNSVRRWFIRTSRVTLDRLPRWFLAGLTVGSPVW
jgi:hypothetical protein